MNSQPDCSYSVPFLVSAACLTYPHLRSTEPEDIAQMDTGWCFLDNPRIDVSSSNILTQIRSGNTDFKGAFQDVADYIQSHQLYGIARPDTPMPENRYEM